MDPKIFDEIYVNVVDLHQKAIDLEHQLLKIRQIMEEQKTLE